MRIFISCFFVFFSSLYACTDFVVLAKDGSVVNGRSLEFAIEFNSRINLFPRNMRVTSSAPGRRNGMQWTSKYGYLGVDAMGMNFSFDGINEKGLSFGYLWLPGITEFPKIDESEMKNVLDFTDFCAWALGNFEKVSEVKDALKDVQIWGHTVQPLGAAPVHAAIHDADGNNLVVEFVGGKMQIYDNPISVLTNSPAFDWHIANLENYLNLSFYNPEEISLRGVSFSPPGQGGGLLGMPGGFSPPARFVKIANFIRFALEPRNANDAVNLAEHFLNGVDIPKGLVREQGKDQGDFTQWIVVKDLTDKILYFRSYGDLGLKKIDLKKLNFNESMNKSIPIGLKKGVFDVTDSLRGERRVTVFMNK